MRVAHDEFQNRPDFERGGTDEQSPPPARGWQKREWQESIASGQSPPFFQERTDHPARAGGRTRGGVFPLWVWQPWWLPLPLGNRKRVLLLVGAKRILERQGNYSKESLDMSKPTAKLLSVPSRSRDGGLASPQRGSPSRGPASTACARECAHSGVQVCAAPSCAAAPAARAPRSRDGRQLPLGAPRAAAAPRGPLGGRRCASHPGGRSARPRARQHPHRMCATCDHDAPAAHRRTRCTAGHARAPCERRASTPSCLCGGRCHVDREPGEAAGSRGGVAHRAH